MLSILVLNWNGEIWLDRCIQSILMQSSQEFEIIAIDNNSSDKSRSIILKYPRVQLIALQSNLGYAGAYNVACKMARGEWLLLLNNDTKLEQNFVAEFTSVVQGDVSADILAPRIRDYEGREEGVCGVGMDIFGYPGFVDAGSPMIFYADGCALIIRKQVFYKLNGFDSEYFIFYEDVDLCWRARLREFIIEPAPSLTVYHYGGGIMGGLGDSSTTIITSEKRRFLGEKNRISNVIRNYSIKNLIWIVPVMIAINSITILVLLSGGQKTIAFAMFKAWMWHARNVKLTLARRSEIQRERSVCDSRVMKDMYWTSIQAHTFLARGIPRSAEL